MFDQRYVKRLDGPNVKKGKNKRDLAEQVIDDIRRFKAEQRPRSAGHGLVRQHRGLPDGERRCTPAWRRFERASKQSDPAIPVEHGLRVRGDQGGHPVRERRAEPDAPTFRRSSSSRAKTKSPLAGKDLKTGQTLIKTIIAPGLKARLLGVEGWYSTNILGNRDGEVLDDPESFKTKEESKKSVLDYILQPQLYPDLYEDLCHVVRINYYPPRGDNKEGWDNIDLVGLARLPDAAQDQLPLPRQHSGGADRARRRAVPGSREARRHARHPGVAVVLLQEPDARAGAVSRSTTCSFS